MTWPPAYALASNPGLNTVYVATDAGVAQIANQGQPVMLSGSPLPEENRAVALIEAKFVKARKGSRSGYGTQIALNEVPPVLLSEVWNDFHQIAGAGSGFAADWRNRVAY